MNSSDRRRNADRAHRRSAFVAAALLVLATVAIFVGLNPFAGHYKLRGVFAAANRPAIGGDVRIAGVRVGEVTAVAPGPGATSILTMRIDDEARPVHADATLGIEARLILEGNFFVNLSPGSPGAPELPSGATIPLSRTASAVQVDQVLGVFDLATRDSLHRGIASLGSALGAPPGGGPAGHAGLQRAMRELDAAADDIGVVARAARGRDSGDLGRALKGADAMSAQMVRDPAALAAIVTSYNRVSAALAADDRALAESIRGFDRTLRAAPEALQALDRTLPTLAEFGRALAPALRAAPSPLRRTSRLLDELGRAVAPRELPGLLDDLAPATARLPGLERRLRDLFPQLEEATECVRTRLVPALNRKVPDGATSTGDPAWLDIVHAFTGLTGASPTFDGNGVSTRAGVTQGEGSLGNVAPGFVDAVGGGGEIQGVRPTWLGYGVEPPYRPDEPCTEQALPDLGLRSGPPPTWQRARTHGKARR